MVQDYTHQTCKTSDRVARWTVVLDYFIGIIPFLFVSTIYNINEKMSRGFVRKMQKNFPAERKEFLQWRLSTKDIHLLRRTQTNVHAGETWHCASCTKTAGKYTKRFVAWNGNCILTNTVDAAMIEPSSKHCKCNDEDSRMQANSQASRGRWKPGDSSGNLNITSEQQPKCI